MWPSKCCLMRMRAPSAASSKCALDRRMLSLSWTHLTCVSNLDLACRHSTLLTRCVPLLQEICLLKSLNYDRNIVQFYGARLKHGAAPMMVLEYMEVFLRRHQQRTKYFLRSHAALVIYTLGFHHCC